jgi:hypothetical protein
VALPVTGDRLGVDGVELMAGGHQGADPQAPVGLDAHRHLSGLCGVLGDQGVQLADTSDALREPP